jgi:hypothetical protein
MPRLHPASTFTVGSGEGVLVSGVIKMRAGRHTDHIGITTVKAPFHVPWVWAEFALTYKAGRFYFYRRASIFPTTSWYIDSDGSLPPNREVTDAHYDENRSTNFVWPRHINFAKLKLFPVLRSGVPSFKQQADKNDTPSGRIDTHPYTAPGAPGIKQWLPGI